MNALEPFIRGNSAVYQVGDNTISISVEEIDPVTAQQYLDTAHNNRTLSNVERFAIDVVAQRWVFTGEPVIFNEDNELMDGNNRLRAVIAGGKPIQTLVVRGVDTKARPYIDTGKSRTLVDVLVMEAACEKYHQAVGYILKRLVCLANNRPVIFRSSTTRAEELSMLKKSKREIVDAVTATYSSLQLNQKRNMMSFLSLWFGRKYPTKVKAFLELLGRYDTEGYVCNPSCPVHQLAKAFDSGKFNGKKILREAELRLAVTAMNMFISGKKGNIAPAIELKMYGTNERLDEASVFETTGAR